MVAPCLALLVALVIGCGGSDNGGGGGDESSAPSSEQAPTVEYTGPEADLPNAYPDPPSGGDFTIGWQNPLGSVESLNAMQESAKQEIECLGGRFIAKDDQLDVDRQVSNMKQLLAQGVDAIGFFPIDPNATRPVLAEAKKQGVPVVAIEATTTPDQPAGDIATQVWQGRDLQAYKQVKFAAELHPGAKIAQIGIGAPVPAIKYYAERVKYWAEQFGLTDLGIEDDPSGDASGGEKAMNALLAKFDDFDVVIAYNDSIAAAAATVARAAGRDVDVIGLNGSGAGFQAVDAGRLVADFQLDDVGIGTQAGRALWTLADDPKAELPPIVVRPPSDAVTQDNAADAATFEEQLKALGDTLSPGSCTPPEYDPLG